ncbi:MAG: hypothetical protein EBZ05_00730 [Verrucomicrobia bacterium]|nr:hypothetical protein [Verrucomicrobiota bacterium]
MNRSTLPKGSTAALVLILGSTIWSLLGAGLSLFSNAQLLIPWLDRLIPAPWFNYGRLVPASQFLLSYGWLGSGLLGVLLILAPRFSGIAFRYGRLLFGGALLWQLAILGGFTQILFEGSSGLIGLPQTRFVSILLILSFLVLGTGLTRGLGRSWKSGPLLPRLYLLLGLLAFPLGLGSAEVLLRGTSAPGSVQLIAQLLWHSFHHHLWLAPLGLVLVFQLLPSLTGRAVSSLNLGLLAWSATALLGGWLGTVRASDGPIPSWMQSTGVVAGILMAFVAIANGLLGGSLVLCLCLCPPRFSLASMDPSRPHLHRGLVGLLGGLPLYFSRLRPDRVGLCPAPGFPRNGLAQQLRTYLAFLVHHPRRGLRGRQPDPGWLVPRAGSQ